MKSSGSVFTTRNPFKSASKVGKTHYHPSGNQYLSKKKKKTNLSPTRLNQESTPQICSLNPESQQPLEKRDNCCGTMDAQAVYTELWPSTDCGSSPASSITSSDTETPIKSARAGQSFDVADQEDSVLAKYIERFRHGRPQSRKERQLRASAIGEEQEPFWWMSPSYLPPSSTPTKTTHKDVIHSLKDDHGPDICSPAVQHQHDNPLSPCTGSLNILLDTSQGEFDDTEILHLQDRASRLLLRGECTPSDGSIPVSSEGLGCSDFSSPVSVDEPVQRPLLKSAAAKVNSDLVQAISSQTSVIHSLTTRPEEDILFQWRLRRKMEQARDWPHAIQHTSLHGRTFSRQASIFSHPSASRQAYKQQQSSQPPEFSQKATHPDITSSRPENKESHGPCPPASNPPPFHTVVVSDSSVSQPQTIAHVPAHMHFLCDVLPCPVQPTRASAQQPISLTTPDEFHAKVVCKKTKVAGNTTEEPALEDVSSLPSVSSKAVRGEWPSHHKKQERNRKDKAQTKESEKTEKKTGASSKKQKKSTRYSVDNEQSNGNHRLPKKVMPWRGPDQQQRTQRFPSYNCTGENTPPPSPVHSALGQVVSEVLFPSTDPSPPQKPSVSSVSPPITASAPPQSSVPPGSAQNSVEVISQLLQEAEDSGEEEFESDPLLQVLRKQRKWVKEQIREVDSMLIEFLDEQQVT